MSIEKVIRLATQPAGGRYNAPFAVQPVIEVGDLDTGNNNFTVDPLYSGSVTVFEGTGNTGYDLTGTVNVPFVNGVATYTNLGLAPDGTNTALDVRPATLVFVTANLNSITSSGFLISNATKLVITTSPAPGSTFNGRPVPTLLVRVMDADDAPVPLQNVSVTATAVGSVLTGTTSLVSDSTGGTSFTGLILTGGTAATITFSAPGLLPASITLAIVEVDIIKPRRSTVAGVAPSGSDLSPYEIAVNIPDRKIWVADVTGTPVLISQFGGGGGSGGTGGTGGTGFYTGVTPPAIPVDGDRWVDASTGFLYTYYTDVNTSSSQWVQF